MRKVSRSLLLVALVASVSYSVRSHAQFARQNEFGAVFVMNNSASRNEIISFDRAADGSLQQGEIFTTGGRGTGGNTDPLESQGSLTLSQDHSLLFAVNGGSGDISVFQVHGSHLALVDKEPTSGSEPNAVAQHGGLVYVLNVGGSSNVVGFRVSANGQLRLIPNSTRFLTTNNSEAASLAFSPNGQFLAVTERATNNIDVFQVLADGMLSPIVVNSDSEPGTFAVSFAPNGAALVSETGPAGGSDASTISSYSILANGTLSAISTGVPTLGNANCWNVVTPNGLWAYVSNAASSTISGFHIGRDGSLTPIGATVLGNNGTGAGNLDIAVTADSKFLYSLNSGNGTIGVFAIEQQGGALSTVSEDPVISAKAGFNGIAAF
jgi:6-phosphogluconolactonase (cycloisomerase 2 family)